ncbi:MAG: mandelate racemase [Armatimonadetes bacterium]|nr:mandelate racemase [Armatimonadota bacterium]
MKTPPGNAMGGSFIMRIAAATVYTKALPLRDPFQHASSGLITHLHEVYLRLATDEGAEGFGEVRGNAHYVTGDTPARIVAVLCDVLCPLVAGADPLQLGAIMDRCDRAIHGNSAAKAVADIALHDLVGHLLNVPACVLLGGRRHDRLATDTSIPFCPPEAAAAQAREYLDAGFGVLKVRVGLRPFARDRERVEAVWATLQAHPRRGDAAIAVDTNQGWTVKEAIRNLRALERYPLAWAEQPIAAGDIPGLAEVRRQIAVPIVADEACKGPEELQWIVRLQAADIVHLKLLKTGGMARMREMMAIAEAAGIGVMVGQMDEGRVATAAAVQCAAAARAASGELWGFQRVAEDVATGIEMRDGHMLVPAGPGLGVRVDESKLEKVAEVRA